MTDKDADTRKPATVQPQAPMHYTPEQLERLKQISEAGRRAMERAERELEQAKRDDEKEQQQP